MRAFVITAPHQASVQDVDPPVAGPGEVVVDVDRVGVCGTDVEIFTGEMAYLHQGHAALPLRPGHEWCGTVSAVGDSVDESWVGQRATGDTMLGCHHCSRCASGRQHLCEDRFEIGIRKGFAGALAEQLLVPVSCLHALPDAVDDVAGALVEPGGVALRAAAGAALSISDRVLVLGAGTIGLLVAQFARAQGAETHVIDRDERAVAFASSIGLQAWQAEDMPTVSFDAVVDASNAPELPALALDLVEPGKRVVYVGLSGRASMVDTRAMVLKDVTSVGVMSASGGLAETIAEYASGAVDPCPLVAATVGLESVADVLAGRRPPGAGRGPKIHVVPRS